MLNIRKLWAYDYGSKENIIPNSATFLTSQFHHVSTSDITIIFTINGLRFHFDAGSGQKTGAFLDQRLNYAAAARYANGNALDICTYQGGFALHMAQNCRHVTGVDASRSALEVAEMVLAALRVLPTDR